MDSAPPNPRLLGDKVPLLRADLVVSPRDGKKGLFEVGRRGEERTFTLYDFEVSISRLLNGQRTVGELIEAAAQIGIPVTQDSFLKYVRQLHAYGFLAEGEQAAATEDPSDPTWTPREEWKPEVRELFQSALRTLRMGRPTVAQSYIEALLEIEPEIPEALALRERIAAQLAEGQSAPTPSFSDLHEERTHPGGPQPLVPDVAAEQPSAQDDGVEDGAALRRRRRPLALAVGGALAALGAAAAVPLPCELSAAAELSPLRAPVVVNADRSGRIGKLLAEEGAWVEEGGPLVALDDGPLRERLRSLERDVATIEKQLGRAEQQAKSSRTRRAAAAVAKKERELEKLAAARDRLKERAERSARLRRQLAAAEKKVDRKQAEVARARALHQALLGQQQRAELAARKGTLEQEREEVQQALGKLTISAPAAGVFSPALRAGDEVKLGERLGTLQDVRALRARIAVPPADVDRVAVGQQVLFTFDGVKGPPITAQLSAAGGGFWSAEATVENSRRALPLSGTGLAQIQCSARPLLFSLAR